MFYKDINEVFNLIKNDKIVRSIAAFIILSCILLAIFFSALSGFIILNSYILGFVVCASLLKYQKTASSCLQRLASFYKGHFSPQRSYTEQVCAICTGPGCTRHLPNVKLPWKNFYIHKKLNNAVEHFYNRIFDQFILIWYKNYTSDKSFMTELQYSLRYATSSLVIKILQLDIGQVITNKLVPCAIKHVDDYLCMIQIAKLKNVDVNTIAVEYLGKRLHVAASSRKNELKYLRYLSSSLSKKVLPQDDLKCSNYSILIREIVATWALLPLMDVLADPNIINSLVILITTYKPKGGVIVPEPIENVEFLCNFGKNESYKSALATDLKTVLKSSQLLYAFMQFLKREGSVNVLNFCLDIEAFNDKLIMPDLSKRQLENLHTEALNLYKVYLDHKSVDFIGCSNEIVLNLHKLLEDGVYNVAKLQTSEPLFQAYDFAFSTLENEWMPQFHHSNEFYNYICGSKVTSTYNKSAARSPLMGYGSPVRVRNRKYYESGSQGTVAKISSGLGRIKGALQTKQPVEGAVYPHESKVIDNDATFVDELLPVECHTIFRDLSAWRISIPSIEAKQYGSKSILSFNINVQRIDRISEHETRHWIVKRRDQDFYTLKSKLIEFHGETEICNSPLPSRRTTISTDARRCKYEDFLRKLLEKPSLKGSDLLHTFLTSKQDFTLLITTSMPIVDLENIYQSVAYKLRKEKGQHLDSFMNTFLNSTGRQKPPKFEWAEVGDEIDPLSGQEINSAYPKTMRNRIFNDNFGVSYKKVQEGSSSSINPSGITEAIFYLLKHIFKVPSYILKLYAAICSVAQQALESMSRLYIEKEIKHALSQPTLAFLIGLLEEVIFDKNIHSTPEELIERKKIAFKELDQSIPNILVTIFGKELKVGAACLLNMLQNPFYNKQLAYNLIDIVIAEMYPDLDSSEA